MLLVLGFVLGTLLLITDYDNYPWGRSYYFPTSQILKLRLRDVAKLNR